MAKIKATREKIGKEYAAYYDGEKHRKPSAARENRATCPTCGAPRESNVLIRVCACCGQREA